MQLCFGRAATFDDHKNLSGRDRTFLFETKYWVYKYPSPKPNATRFLLTLIFTSNISYSIYIPLS